MKVFNKDHFADKLLNALLGVVEKKRQIATHKLFRSDERKAMSKFIKNEFTPRDKFGTNANLGESRSDWEEESLLSHASKRSKASSIGNRFTNSKFNHSAGAQNATS